MEETEIPEKLETVDGEEAEVVLPDEEDELDDGAIEEVDDEVNE